MSSTSPAFALTLHLGLSPFDAVRRLTDLVSAEVIQESVETAASWLLESADAARRDGRGVCYRDILFFRDGSHRWLYPHANMGEQIDTMLNLWELLDDPLYLTAARNYADRMLDDPEKGIYQGPNPEPRGLTYYWRETGSYTGMYSMRAVAPLHRLGELTGDERYTDAARMVAEPLLKEITGTGLPRSFAWVPGEGLVGNFPDSRVGSRVGYLVGVYAFCATVLKDDRAWVGWERLKHTLLCVQRPDGALPQDFTYSGAPGDTSVKNHFFGYILNGLANSLELIPDDSESLELATRIAEFCKGQLNYFGSMPMCASNDNQNITDRAALFHPITDPAPALLRLATLLDRPDYWQAGERIWFQHLGRQVHAPEWPEAHGSLPTTIDPMVAPSPELLTYAGNGVPHLEENPERVACSSSYYVNQYVQAGCLLLKAKLAVP